MTADVIPIGLTAGSIYAVVALGFNVMARPTNVFNFAQGDLAMLGALFAAIFLAHMPWGVAAAAALVTVGVIALVEYATAIAPVLRRSATATGWVISTLAFSLVIENLVGKFWGASPRTVALPPGLSLRAHQISGMRVSSYEVALILFTALALLTVEAFYRTRQGRAVLAVAEDRDAALLRGIDPTRLTRWSFFAGGALAALAGLLAGPILLASTGLGSLLLVKGFEAATVGGIGNSRGALIGGYAIGLTEAVGASYLAPGYQVTVTFVLMLLILLIRPRGILGLPEARLV